MKMFKLIQNETIKTLKKTSTKIILFLAVIALLAAVGFANLTVALNDSMMSYNYEDNYEGDWKQEMKENISELKKEIESENSNYDKQTKAYNRATMETYQIALDNDINFLYFYNNYWKIELLNEILETKEEIYFKGTNKEENEKSVNEKIELLKNNDYSKFIESRKKEEKTKLDKKIITQEEYNDNIYLLELCDKYGFYKEDSDANDWKTFIYEDIETIKKDLRTGIAAATGKLLKVEDINKLNDQLKMDEYRLENDIPTLLNLSSARKTYDSVAPGFSLVFVALLMIIIGGSSISSEISKGTIKFLLFTPNKRWKILLAKIISAIFILFVSLIILSLLCVLFGNIFFEEEGTRYLFVKDGEIGDLSTVTYMVLYFLAGGIDILVYTIFAIMLSTLTRNTAISVGASIGCYVGSGIVMELLNYFLSADWIKFIPFNNLEMADRIFANNISYSAIQLSINGTTSVLNTPVTFSFAVLGVTVILMLVSMFDSFNKRDIV